MGYTPKEPHIYKGKQVIINSDRILFNAKDDSILLFSKEAIGFSTKGSFNFDTDSGTNCYFTINSPKIYLGLQPNNDLPTEPAVLGDYLGDIWLDDLLEMLDGLIEDLTTTYALTTTMPGLPTAPNSANRGAFQVRKQQISNLRHNVKYFKSETTKLI